MSGVTTLGQSRSWSICNKEVLRILQSSSITRTSLSDGLVSIQDIHWRETYSFADMQSVYFTAPADWALCDCVSTSA